MTAPSAIGSKSNTARHRVVGMEGRMSKLIDNNGFTVCRGSGAKLLAFVGRQRRYDPTYALWLVSARGVERVL
jgi:hypothetical protein